MGEHSQKAVTVNVFGTNHFQNEKESVSAKESEGREEHLTLSDSDMAHSPKEFDRLL